MKLRHFVLNFPMLFDANPALWLIPLFPVFFIGLWAAIIFLISRLSGWAKLADRFRSDLPFAGQKWSWQSARMRVSNYGNSLTVGADPTGLYLATFFLLRLGHAPLLIPWHEITIRRRWKILFLSYVEFGLGREEQISFSIKAGLADQLRAAAGTAWPAEPTP